MAVSIPYGFDIGATDGPESDPVLRNILASPVGTHKLTPLQRAELDRRRARLPAHIAAGRMRSTADMTATIERTRIEQGG